MERIGDQDPDTDDAGGSEEVSEEELRAAIAELEEAVAALDPEEEAAAALSALTASALHDLWNGTGDDAALARAAEFSIAAARIAAVEGGAGHQDVLDNAVVLLVEATLVLARSDLIDVAVDIARDALALATDGPVEPGAAEARGADQWNALAAALRVRYEFTTSPEDLAEAERAGRKALETGVAADQPLPGAAAELSYIMLLKWQADYSIADLDEAERLLRRSVEQTRDPSTARLRRSRLAGILVDLHLAGCPDALVAAVREARAATAPPKDGRDDSDPETSEILQIGAEVLTTWAEARGDAAAASEAAELAARSVACADPATLEKAVAYQALGNALSTRFQLTGKLRDLDGAVDAYRSCERAGAGRADPGSAAGYAGNLGKELILRYETTGQARDLDEGTACARRAEQLGRGRPDEAMHQSNLSIALGHQYRRGGGLAILDEAVSLARAAAECAPDDPFRAGRLANLGSLLSDRFALTGRTADLDETVALLREAVAITRSDDERLPGLLNNLANMLHIRADHDGSYQDLEDGVALIREALALDAPGPRTADLWATLGLIQHAQYEARREGPLIDAAVASFRRSLTLTPHGDPDRYARVSDFATVLETAAARSPAAARSAVRLLRSALRRLPGDHPQAATLRTNLALALARRAGRGDLDRAVDYARRAVVLGPRDLPDRALNLANLAYTLWRRAQLPTGRVRTRDDRTAARAALRESALVPVAAPAVRLTSARNWGLLAREAGATDEAVCGLTLAVRLLPEASPRRLAQVDGQRRLAEVTGLAGAAAAACLEAGSPRDALEMLELGRGVLLGRVLGARGDTAQLHAVAPELAERFEILRERLDGVGAPLPVAARETAAVLGATPGAVSGTVEAPGGDGTPGLSSATEARDRVLERVSAGRPADDRRDDATRFYAVVEEIRRLPDFPDFLRTPSVETLAAEAAEGPLVTLNVDSEHCDALLLTDAGLRVLPLDALTADDADRYARDLHAVVLRASEAKEDEALELAAQRQIGATLDWLWRTVVRPVLDALDMRVPMSDAAGARTGLELPRLWWIPTGPLCLLPLHAATDAATGECVLDHVVPSYTSTINMLHHARRRPTARSAAEAGSGAETGAGYLPSRPVVLTHFASATSERDAPGADPAAPALAGAEGEARDIAALLGVTPLDAGVVPAEELVRAIGACDVFHLASHAYSDDVDPSSSSFVLRGLRLTFRDLSALHNTTARLAYLSACETTRVTAALADEALNLTMAVYVAGFGSVMGTQWRVPDLIAERAAKQFYREWLTAGRPPAEALRRTVLMLRRRYPEHPSVWASYHYTGV